MGYLHGCFARRDVLLVVKVLFVFPGLVVFLVQDSFSTTSRNSGGLQLDSHKPPSGYLNVFRTTKGAFTMHAHRYIRTLSLYVSSFSTNFTK